MGKQMLSSFVLMAGMLIALSSTAQAANLLKNPDFEDGKVGASWTTGTIPGWQSEASWEVQDYYIHKGSKAMKIWDPSVKIYQDFSVSGGSEYTISAYAYTPLNDQLNKLDSVLEVEWYSNGSKVGLEEVGWFYGLGSSHGTPVSVDTWKLISKTIAAPFKADTGRVCLHFANQQEGWKGSVAWDDMSVSLKKAVILR